MTPNDDDARDLVADLAARGGDVEAVTALLLEAADEHRADPAALVTLLLTSLCVTFAECLTGPASTPYKEHR